MQLKFELICFEAAVHHIGHEDSPWEVKWEDYLLR